MAGVIEILEAPTRTELRQKAIEWERQAKGNMLSDIRAGYDPERVQQSDDGGFWIQMIAHS